MPDPEEGMPRIVVINGPNLNLLGTREPEIYGHESLDSVNERLARMAADMGIEISFFQSNHEGELIDMLQREAAGADGVIMNPGALAHYSHALRDGIAASGARVVEVHISNIYGREAFRQHSVVAPACIGQITGLGVDGYALALRWLADSMR
jgi:3-dehydroquinate dehydratase II